MRRGVRRVGAERVDSRHGVREALWGAHLSHTLLDPGRELFEVVAVARQLPEHAATADLERLPSEDGPVEGLRTLDVTSVQVVEVQRAVLVHDPRTLVVLRLPDEEHGPFGVAEGCHPARVHDVHRLHQYLPTGGLDLLGRLIGAVHPDVGVPHRHRRAALGLRSDGRYVTTAYAANEVLHW